MSNDHAKGRPGGLLDVVCVAVTVVATYMAAAIITAHSGEDQRLHALLGDSVTMLCSDGRCGGWYRSKYAEPGRHLFREVIDTWGHPLVIDIEHRDELAEVTVRSCGPDGIPDTADDIVNNGRYLIDGADALAWGK